MEGFKAIPYIFLAVAVAAIIGGASSVSMGEFQSTVTQCWNSSYTYNATEDNCNAGAAALQNATFDTRNFTYEYYAIWNGQDATGTVAQQLNVVSVVAVMVVIIGLLAGVLVYFKFLR